MHGMIATDHSLRLKIDIEVNVPPCPSNILTTQIERFFRSILKQAINKKVQTNLCTTTTLKTLNLWPLLTGGRFCSEVDLCYQM